MVSRNHCEVYAIAYEPSASYHIYVRDRKSINGTFVNGQPIGIGPELSAGFLLDDGDVVEIRPYWKFSFNQTATVIRHELTRTQQAECEVKYIICVATRVRADNLDNSYFSINTS